MSNPSNTKSIFILVSAAILIISATYAISIFARGYQFSFNAINNKGSILKATGLLSATSKPKSASVYVDDRLITATDDTLNLSPDTYNVKIVKDGYLPWQKTISIKKEVVYQTDTQLYRSVPDLKPITLTGAINPTISSDYSKIVYSVASASATKDNGLYLIELTENPIPINRNTPKQIANNFSFIDWSKFTFTFSPNSREILATNSTSNVSYLLNLNSPITQNNLFDVTPRIALIKDDWQNQIIQINQTKLEKMPLDFSALVSTDSAKSIAFSTDETKILYIAKSDGKIKDHIIDSPPAQSTQIQTREIKKGNYYVYDLKDDTNFLIGKESSLQNLTWLPNSNSIIFTENQAIQVIEYDSTNKQTLFAGNFNKNVVYPWADGSRIITLTAPYSGASENLYSITIR